MDEVHLCDVCHGIADIIMWHGQNGVPDVWYCYECANDYYEDDVYDDEGDGYCDAFDEALSTCSMMDIDSGECGAAGSEDCEFHCVIRQMWERGDFEDDEENGGDT